jgi:hypothetical protein
MYCWKNIDLLRGYDHEKIEFMLLMLVAAKDLGFLIFSTSSC